MSRSSVKMVFSRSTESFRRGTFLCFRKFRVSKNIMPMKGISRFSIESFSSHSTNKFCNGTLLPFTNILVTRKIMNKRGGGGWCNDFPSNLFFLTVPKDFVGELFRVSEVFGYRRILCLGGEHDDFLQKTCCLTVPKFS